MNLFVVLKFGINSYNNIMNYSETGRKSDT